MPMSTFASLCSTVTAIIAGVCVGAATQSVPLGLGTMMGILSIVMAVFGTAYFITEKTPKR